MGKQTQQGTRWESRIRDMARRAGRKSIRMPKTGKKHEPDLMVVGNPMRPAVAWERWKKTQGKRRVATRMVTITEAHFKELLDKTEYGYYIQCKSTQAGSLSAWLDGLEERLEQDAKNAIH